ncbi:hypothetical protein C8R47DRAFT_1227784 [Mycena vitilis]|nr:hypothetical protein C8R47DRAFT_1227784 [Mycena vitilis]
MAASTPTASAPVAQDDSPLTDMSLSPGVAGEPVGRNPLSECDSPTPANRGQSRGSATKRSASQSPGSLKAAPTSSLESSDSSDSSSLHSPSPPSGGARSATHGSAAHGSATAGWHPQSAFKRTRTASRVSSEYSRPAYSVKFNMDSREAEPGRRADVDTEDDQWDSPSPSPDPKDLDFVDDQHEDPEEEPARRRKPVPKGTPKHRSATTSSVRTSIKDKVLDAARLINALVSTVFCLLTNAREPPSFMQFCHVLARRSKDPVLTKLEWWWQLPYWTLYVDSRFNIFPLMSQLHLAMDAGDWAFVPHHEIIDAIYKWIKALKKRDPTGYNKGHRSPISELYRQIKFIYFVLPLTDFMKRAGIHRYGPEFDPEVDATAVEHHYWPFKTIGPVPSHIHPHLVIYSAGEKLARKTLNMEDDEREAVLDSLAEIACFGHPEDDIDHLRKKNKASLESILSIYADWSSDVHVPKKGSGHEWRKHKDAPSEEEEQEEEEQEEQEEEVGNAAADGAENP